MSTSELSHAEQVAMARLQALLGLLPTALDRQLLPAGLTSFEYSLLTALAGSEDRRLRLSSLALDAEDRDQLSRLALTILGRLDPGGRLAVTVDGRLAGAVDHMPSTVAEV